MLINPHAKNKGASLLELMLVVLIASILMLYSIANYKQKQKYNDIYVLQASIADLMNGLNNYYFMECAGNNMITNQDIKPELKKLGLLNNHQINNPWGGEDNITAEIVKDDNNFYRLKVSVDLILKEKDADYQTALAGFIRGILNGDVLNDSKAPNAVTWTRLPLYSRDDLSSHEWIFEPRPASVTAVNNGLSSNLWVLNRNLQAFTKQNENQTNVQPSCVN